MIDTDMLRRAGIVALVLGTILALANQYDALFGEAAVQTLPLVLVYLTPFVVVTISQALGRRQAILEMRRGGALAPHSEAFLDTAMSHGIPLRSLLVALLASTVSTSVVAVATVLERGDLAAMPTALIGQAFVLPALFGLLSQTISYRRAVSAMAQRVQAEAQPVSIRA